MIKKTGYVLFAFFFFLFRLFPVNRQKVFFVATHDDSKEGNIGIVAIRSSPLSARCSPTSPYGLW